MFIATAVYQNWAPEEPDGVHRHGAPLERLTLFGSSYKHLAALRPRTAPSNTSTAVSNRVLPHYAKYPVVAAFGFTELTRFLRLKNST